MKLTWDENKRARVLAERGLDKADCPELFAGSTISSSDLRQDYGEVRTLTYGFISGRLCAVVWTERDETRHITSLSKRMTESKKCLKPEWVDPDDAPDMGDTDWFDHADVYHGEKLVSRGRPRLDDPKVSTTIRLDADLIEEFRAKGPGWQTRINDALRDWLKRAG